ncbi:uncharacterized protein F5147DRAFT_652959 [Suillus discolor]|uniref:Uncharacterized protein n=1 Tax=Suillus discolor TaxID=1912936 RepID=A0A9P7F7C6_9AGAM|nr:uncharacterized protein F5147DRAFT_652959 [Suillus discolor]KAG2108239.1 hypothetical protein F5147DRAFT_652959 [Suillus discolor]
MSLDLTIGLLGKQVPVASPKLRWKDGHTTILPMVHGEGNINVCKAVDIPIIRFMADFPTSTSSSKNVLHLKQDALGRKDILAVVGNALSTHLPVVIRGVSHERLHGSLSEDYLDERSNDSVNQSCPSHKDWDNQIVL